MSTGDGHSKNMYPLKNGICTSCPQTFPPPSAFAPSEPGLWDIAAQPQCKSASLCLLTQRARSPESEVLSFRPLFPVLETWLPFSAHFLPIEWNICYPVGILSLYTGSRSLSGQEFCPQDRSYLEFCLSLVYWDDLDDEFKLLSSQYLDEILVWCESVLGGR